MENDIRSLAPSVAPPLPPSAEPEASDIEQFAASPLASNLAVTDQQLSIESSIAQNHCRKLENQEKRNLHRHFVWRCLVWTAFYATLFYSSGGPFFLLSIMQQCGLLSSWVRTECRMNAEPTTAGILAEQVLVPPAVAADDGSLASALAGYLQSALHGEAPEARHPNDDISYQARPGSPQQAAYACAAPVFPLPYEKLVWRLGFPMTADPFAVFFPTFDADAFPKAGAKGVDTTPSLLLEVADEEGSPHDAAATSSSGTAASLDESPATTSPTSSSTFTRFHVMSLMGQNYFAFSLPYYVAAFLVENYIIYYVMERELRHKPSLPGSISNLGQGVLMFLCSQMLFLNYKDPVYAWIFDHFRMTDAFRDLDDPTKQWAVVHEEQSIPVPPFLIPSYSSGALASLGLESWVSPAFFVFVCWWVCLLQLDFFYYCWHRASHRMSWLWAAHWVHHSTEEYNISVTFREPIWWSEMLIPLQFAIMRAPVAVFGFPIVFMNTISLNDTLYMNMLHTELIDPLPRAELLFMTPSLHRVHHARNLRALAKNFGSLFSIWDRLGGSYEPEYLPSASGKFPTQYLNVEVDVPKPVENRLSVAGIAVVDEQSTLRLRAPLLAKEDSTRIAEDHMNKNNQPSTLQSKIMPAVSSSVAAIAGSPPRSQAVSTLEDDAQEDAPTAKQGGKVEDRKNSPSGQAPTMTTATSTSSSASSSSNNSLLSLLKRYYIDRQDTRKCKDDREPLRYGVIPQFHSYDIWRQNLEHWLHMFRVQPWYNGHGIAAPFLHWTKPGSRCPPLSERSRINGYKKFRADALHIGWSVYVILEFIVFFFAALGFVATNYDMSVNLAKTFYGSCYTPFMLPETCMPGPIAEYFGPQKLVAACLQVAGFMLGMWTMANIGEIMMATEKAPSYVGVPEGYAPIPDAVFLAGGGSGSGGQSNGVGTVSQGITRSKSTLAMTSAKDLAFTMQAPDGKDGNTAPRGSTTSSKDNNGISTDSLFFLRQSTTSCANADEGRSLDGSVDVNCDFVRTRSGANQRDYSQSLKVEETDEDTRERTIQATEVAVEEIEAALSRKLSASTMAGGAPFPSGSAAASTFISSSYETSARSSTVGGSLPQAGQAPAQLAEAVKLLSAQDPPAVTSPRLSSASSCVAVQSSAMSTIAGGSSAVASSSCVVHSSLYPTPSAGSTAVQELSAGGGKRKTSNDNKDKIFHGRDPARWQGLGEQNLGSLIYTIHEDNAPELLPGEKVYERKLIYAEMLRHWFVVFWALQFGDAMYNDSDPDSAATVSRKCTMLTLAYAAFHVLALPLLVFFGNTRWGRESAARRRYRG
ncbi:unnamed protein product [Amoebophrya sp. A25]|nr:unnamed protein product [Amoebophrya sp. A25]|eukprot:GSA25T00015490001.1